MLGNALKLILAIVLIVIPAMAGPTGTSASRQNELLVIGAIKKLYAAQHQYLSDRIQSGGDPAFGTLEQLGEAGLIDEKLAAGEKFGYRFSVLPQMRSVTNPADIILNAWPSVYRKTGVRSFLMNIDCGIKASDREGGFAEFADPVIDSCTPTIAYEYSEQAMEDLRLIANAQFTYFATIGNYSSYATIPQLIDAGLIDQRILGNFHRFEVQLAPPTLMAPATFKVWSTPFAYRSGGMISLFMDETGVLRGSDHAGKRANQDDPPIEFNFSGKYRGS